ncbi:nucleoside deaminase [Microbulbifer sediminum]|uniref:nucleoside deaminase n=1 Tax=Microbulbifer sediminum TaxID=2904250 RepID=UPI001F46344A|nr:nucleoside deaminase [Microbulbifer sediminum]
MMSLFNKQTENSDAVLRAIAHMPTKSLHVLMAEEFTLGLSDTDFMRIAVFLAEKSYAEGGCPIGAVIIDNSTRKILGKGHNTLVQENHPYNHGETCAIRDAGRIDFSTTTLFTSLSPCDICATLIYMRGFSRVVIGDVTNAGGNENFLEEKGIPVDILQDRNGISLYARFRSENPDQELEDWHGLSAVKNQGIK